MKSYDVGNQALNSAAKLKGPQLMEPPTGVETRDILILGGDFPKARGKPGRSRGDVH